MKTTAFAASLLATVLLSAAPAMAATGDTPTTTTGPAGSTIKNTGKPPAARTDNARPSASQAEQNGVGGGAPGAMGKQSTESGNAPRGSASGGYPAQHK